MCDVRRGSFCRRCDTFASALASGLLSHVGRRGTSLVCRQGARFEETSSSLHASQTAAESLAAHAGGDASSRAVGDANGSGSLADGSVADQGAEAALQHSFARRQELPFDPVARRPCLSANREASRQAAREGKLFRTFCFQRCGQFFDRRVAENFLVALLQRFDLCASFASVLAVSYQTLLCPLRGLHGREELRAAGLRGEGVFERQVGRRARAAGTTDDGSEPSARVRTCRVVARSSDGVGGDSGTHALRSAARGRGGCVGVVVARGGELYRNVLFSQPSSLRQPRFFSSSSERGFCSRNRGFVHRAVLRLAPSAVGDLRRACPARGCVASTFAFASLRTSGENSFSQRRTFRSFRNRSNER